MNDVGGRPAATRSRTAGNFFSIRLCERDASLDNQCRWLVDCGWAMNDQVIRLRRIVGRWGISLATGIGCKGDGE